MRRRHTHYLSLSRESVGVLPVTEDLECPLPALGHILPPPGLAVDSAGAQRPLPFLSRRMIDLVLVHRDLVLSSTLRLLQ